MWYMARVVQAALAMPSKRLLLAVAALTVASLACSSSVSGPSPAPEANGAPSPSDPSAPPSGDPASAPDGGPPSGDAGIDAAGRANDAGGADVAPVAAPRDCGTHLTTPVGLVRAVVHPVTRTAFLGEGVVNGAPSGTAYAVESSSRLATGDTSTSGAGPDRSADDIAGSLDPRSGNQIDTFVDHDAQGNNPLVQWGAAYASSATRMSYVVSSGSRETAWTLSPEQKTTTTPSDDQAMYVRYFQAHRYAAYALVVDASACTLGALSDVRASSIGSPDLGGSVSYPVGGLLDPSVRAAAQQVLVRDGATITLALVANRPWPQAEQIVQSTACAPDDLAACADAMSALNAAYAAYWNGVQPSDYAALKAGSDPSWDITSFGTGIVLYLQ